MPLPATCWATPPETQEASRTWTCWSAAAEPSPPPRDRPRRRSSCWTAYGRWASPSLAIDSAGALPPLGALDDSEIGEGMGVLRDDLLVPLGAAVVSRGGRSGQLAMRVSVHRTGWPDQAPIEVRGGSLQVLPLGRGQAAELEIELSGGVTLGVRARASACMPPCPVGRWG